MWRWRVVYKYERKRNERALMNVIISKYWKSVKLSSSLSRF